MLIVDAQVHIWGDNIPTNPSHRQIPSYTADDLLNQAELTSRMRKQNRDRIAAQIILQSWLAAPNKNSTPKPFDD